MPKSMHPEGVQLPCLPLMIKSMQRLQTVLLSLLVFLSASLNAPKADVLIPEWLSYDSAKKQAHFKLIAAKNANNNGYNYNGYYQGNISLKVPVDWLIRISLTNWDANSTHDIILTRPFVNDDIPDELTGQFSTIKRAYITPLFANESDTLSFISKAGQYWLFCGVKGHGIDGMWIKLEADNKLQSPIIKTKNRE